jgi:tetratricopeptide (TPR) repeat protein
MLRFLLVALTVLVLCDLTAAVKAGSQKEEPKASKDSKAPPAQEPTRSLSPAEREQRLRERDGLEAEAKKLWAAGKLAEAITAAEKMLAIERQVFGDRADDVVGSLQWLASLHKQREDFSAAGQRLREVRDIQTARYGQDDWRVADARLTLADVLLLAKLDSEQRKQLADAAGLNEQIIDLYEKGKSREAVPLAERALDLRKQVLGDKHPYYASSLNNLALLYTTTSDYAKAEPLYRQASSINKQTLGDKRRGSAGGVARVGCANILTAGLAGRKRSLVPDAIAPHGTAHVALDVGPGFRQQGFENGLRRLLMQAMLGWGS